MKQLFWLLLLFPAVAHAQSVAIDLGSFGPLGRSETEVRAFHLATVFEFTP